MALERLGPYRLEKTLGRGGMGAVFLGIHQETLEKAAVKVLATHLADDQVFRERFKSEVQTLKQLLHPNIVKLHGYGEEDGHLYYVMEYVPGRNLQDEMAAGRRFTWREVTRIGVQVAQALKHAHDRGIVHRDLKPANLLLTDDEQIKLTDFGIAKLYGGTHVTADGSVMGTADYMSPEQARGKQVTSRCDLYSLGSVLYALLTGKPPFAGKSLTEVIHNLMQEKPIALRRLAPDTPAELESIVLQLLEKEPQNRIPTAIAVANRLKAMEHALSLETRIEVPGKEGTSSLDNDDFELQPLDDSRPASRLTARNSKANATVDILGSDGLSALENPSPLHSGEMPTIITGPAPSPLAGKPTQATGLNGVSPSAVTNVADPDEYIVAPTPPKSTHFTTISDADLRGTRAGHDHSESSLAEWAKIGGVIVAALALIGAMAFFLTRAPSANSLAATIQKAVDTNGNDGLVEVDSELQQFLTRFADDPRAEQMRGYAQEVELYRLQKTFERRARRASEEKGLLPVERLYLQAQKNITADPATALAQFKAIVQMLAGDRDPAASPTDQRAAEQCLQLAEKQISQLEKVVEVTERQQRLLIRRQLERAAKLATDKPDEAEALKQSIITLFGDKPWAADLVEEARKP
ncbi:serine/threonine-protein kinase [Anatilimnocola floriformis]|uniref:serine/threonine-protein kinase n=1 Tax=Anatilimnocola floriformis TaxID=2948575 RepID=UPI0020C4ACFE|nr:serine/threonine-protein kinase [Anatilimnocola floriformis]